MYLDIEPNATGLRDGADVFFRVLGPRTARGGRKVLVAGSFRFDDETAGDVLTDALTDVGGSPPEPDVLAGLVDRARIASRKYRSRR